MKDRAKPAERATEETPGKKDLCRPLLGLGILINNSFPAMNRWAITDRPLRGLNYGGRPLAYRVFIRSIIALVEAPSTNGKLTTRPPADSTSSRP